jgi:thiol-disulfide isomerase/thioredoxin
MMMKKVLFILLINFQLSAHGAEKIKMFDLPVFGQDRNVKLAELLKNSKVVLNFWASWCTACAEEIPLLEELKKKNPDVLFIGINAGEKKRKIKKFLKKHKFSYMVLEDNKKAYTKSIGVLSLPQTIVLEQDGTISYHSHIPPKTIK